MEEKLPGSAPSYLRPGVFESIFGRTLVLLVRIGLVRGHFYVLEVRGRKSGKTITLPVDPLDLDRQRYLVCARGNSNWVGNARTAGEVVLVRAMRRRRYLARELPPDMRPAILKAYLDRFAGEVQRFFPVPKGRRWRHSTIWRRVIRSLSCSCWTSRRTWSVITILYDFGTRDTAGCAAVLLPGTNGAPAAAIAARLDLKRSFGPILFHTLFSLAGGGYGARGRRHRSGLDGAATRNGGYSDDSSCVDPGA